MAIGFKELSRRITDFGICFSSRTIDFGAWTPGMGERAFGERICFFGARIRGARIRGAHLTRKNIRAVMALRRKMALWLGQRVSQLVCIADLRILR